MTFATNCVVFDFDGLLVDSNRIKRQAYYDVFQAVPIHASIVTRCLTDHKDGDRRDVITAIVRTFTGVDSERECLIARYLEAYARECDAQIARCAEQPGASAVLTTLAARYPLYVNSATPVESLERYIDDRGWTPHFRRVLGRPQSKIENFAVIRAIENITDRSVLFVGDHQSDMVAAESANCSFVGVKSDDSDFLATVEILESLWHLPEYLQALARHRC
jgi:phosphoglycolate phosphatase